MVTANADAGATAEASSPDSSGIWAALAVRPSEVEQIRRLLACSTLVGFALVCFFSGSNALFLDRVGADRLPWVYLLNAPLVVAAGFGYAWWSRRAATTSVLQGSVWLLTASVAALWLWNVVSDGQAAPFALAVWFRFLFIFGFLGLWEIASAVFDTRQSKRLFPAVALGAMLAFMIGGTVISGLTALIDTVHLIALSAVFFGLYSLAFARAIAGADFEAADASTPATPRQIVSDRFSRNLAAMRSLSILLIFITEFVFYQQVGENFDSDSSIARFLAVFLAAATLAMVIVTAVFAGRYIARFGVGVGLLTMPAGVAAMAVLMGLYGIFIGVDFGFFVLAVAANLINMVLANAIETPVGAVMYQPMPVERRMPVRVAVDGWLGSVAVLLSGLLLLAFDAFNFSSVVPFVWLLAAIGLAGVALGRRLYDDYRNALDEATTLAFSVSGSPDGFQGRAKLLAELDESRSRPRSGIAGSIMADDPAAALAVASLARDLTDAPLALALPTLAANDDPDVARLAVDALASSGDPAHADLLADIAVDPNRAETVRAGALEGLLALRPDRAALAVAAIGAAFSAADAPLLDVTVAAVGLACDPTGPDADRLGDDARSPIVANRRRAAQVLAATAEGVEFTETLQQALADLIEDTDPEVRSEALVAARHRVTAKQGPNLGLALVAAGRHPQHRRLAVEALATGGSETAELLNDVVAELPEAYVVDLVEHVYGATTRRPVLLHRFVEPTAISAIRRAGFDATRRADVNLPATIDRMLRDDAEFARLLLAAWRDRAESSSSAPTVASAPLIDVVLIDEFNAAREAIWAGLRLVADSERISEIELLARGDDDEVRANAIEALDTLLPHSTRQLVLPILEPKTISEAVDLVPGLDPHQDAIAALSGVRDHPRTMDSSRRLVDHHLPVDRRTEHDDMSDTIERVIALKRVDIFATLPYEVLAELAEVAERREAPAGSEIIVEGEFGDELFALTEGEVKVDRSDGVSTVLSAGTVFGELAVLDPGPRSATVTAQGDCELLAVARPMLLALTDRRPEVMAEIARVLSVRLRNNP